MERTTRVWTAAGCAAAALLALGCGRAVTTGPAGVEQGSLPLVPADRYQAVFDSAVTVLRDLRFVVDRQDARFGVVTTEPLTASSFFEPWYIDNTTAEQVWASTLNLRRRTVRVQFTESGDGGGAYGLDVQVAVEQRQDPTKQVYTSAARGTTVARAAGRDRTIRTERGEVSGFWRPVGRDGELESRLAAMILDRAAGPGAEADPDIPAQPIEPAEPTARIEPEPSGVASAGG